jgi:FixJ family two-component response regulator
MSRPEPLVAIVDDDSSLCRALGRLLKAAGMQAVTYASAEAFLADPDRSRFDCLVLDIQLGGMSGIELSQSLAASGSTTPVIFSTAHHRPEIRELAMKENCVAYLRKADSGESVLAAIHRAIGIEHPNGAAGSA